MKTSEYKNPIYLEVLAWLLLIGLIVFPVFFYHQLPEEIPSHYNAKGEPDAFSDKGSIWILPIIGTAVFLFLHVLSNAKLFRINVGKKLSPEEEAHQVLQGKKMLSAFKVIIPLAFWYINFKTIKTALGESDGLGIGFLIIFLISVFGVIFFYSYQKRM